jgi:hypothetical protein
MTKKEALAILKPEGKDEDSLKKAYRAAAIANHPDHGGNVHAMQLVNAAYEALKGAWWTPYDGRMAAKEEPLTEAIIKVWDSIKHFQNIRAEVCGRWLWVFGETWRYKKELKSAGFKWSGKKRGWYWHNDAGYRKKSKREWGMNDIRSTFGSADLTPETSNALPA